MLRLQASQQVDRPNATPKTIGSTTYINSLPDHPIVAVAYGATLIHFRTQEEIHIDILVDSDRFCDVIKAIRRYYPVQWRILETWEIVEDTKALESESFANYLMARSA